MKSDNITWHAGHITREDREKQNGHRGAILWFTGLSGSGKSTIAVEVEKQLFDRGVRAFMLDGDNVRHGLNSNLGFSPEDREENIRRIGEVAKLFSETGMVTLASFISPYRKDREQVRQLATEGEFIEVYVKADVDVCRQRDPKGLYKKADAGKISEFTGVSAPYEEPESPELVLDTAALSVKDSAGRVIDYLIFNNIIS